MYKFLSGKKNCLFLIVLFYFVNIYALSGADSISGKVYNIKTVYIESKNERDLKSMVPFQKIDSKGISERGIVDIADALNRFSGVNIKDYGGSGGLKTISVRGLGSRHTAVSYNGVVINGSRTGQIDLSSLSLNDIGTLSVVSGNYDDIFVSAREMAASSLLKIESVSPSFEEKKYNIVSSSSVGSFGLLSSFFKYSRKINNRFTVSGLIEGKRADNLYHFTLTNGENKVEYRRNNNSLRDFKTEADFYYRPGAKSVLKGVLYYYGAERDLPGAVRYYNYNNNESTKERNLFCQAVYKKYFSRLFAWSIKGKFNRSVSGYHDTGGEYPGGEIYDKYFQREYYCSSSLLYNPIKKVSFSYSVDYFFNNLNSNHSYDIRPYRHSLLQGFSASYDKERFRTVVSVLGSLYKNRVNAGESASGYKRLSPYISFSCFPFGNSRFSVRAFYKDIFRVPSFTDNYFTQVASRNIRPEKTTQFDLGACYKKKSGGASVYKINFDVYYNTVRDKIVAMPNNMFYWSVVNLGKVRILGLDFNSEYKYIFDESWSFLLYSSYSYQYAVDVTDSNSGYYKDQIVYTPRYSGSFSIAVENPYINVSVHGTGAGRSYCTPENTMAGEIDGYVDLGLALYGKLNICGNIYDVRGDIINITDKQYEVVKKYPMPGRQYKLTIKINI